MEEAGRRLGVSAGLPTFPRARLGTQAVGHPMASLTLMRHP